MRRFLLLFIMASIVVPAGAAQAETIAVTNTNDSGDGSLRAAILAANGHSGEDAIAIGVSGAIQLNTMLPVVEGIITITGPGPGSLAIEPAAATGFRILSFGDGTAAVMSGLTIRGGTSRQGGGIRSGENSSLFLTRVVVAENEARDEGGSEAVAEGGGIFSEGELVLRESTIRDNTATAVAGTTSSSALGGGVLAAGPITVERSTISGNVAEAHGEGGGHSRAWGGGMRTVVSSSATVEVSTVSGNSVAADNSLTNEARGGGLEGAEMNLTSSTLVGNSLHSIGGAMGANLAFSGTATVSDTIVAEPGGDAESCASQLGSGGFNLDEDGSCEFGQATDLAGVASGVDPVLRDNGGPTPTHALLEGSPAIDRGGVFMVFDQRGLPRPIDFASVSNTEGGNGSDIGAFALQAPPPPAVSGGPVLVSQQPADRQPPNTRIVKGPARSTYETEAKFRFASTEAQSSFQCKFDTKKWAGCRNPAKRTVKPGKHLFKVRAIDRFGNVDPTPARFGWRVKPLS